MKQLLILCGLSAIVFLQSCSNHKDETPETVQLLATSPIKTDTVIVKKYVSQIRSIRHIEIRSQERGYLEKIFVDEGQYVHKGQLLFQIMPNVYNAEFQKAQAEVQAANIELQNTQKLADKDVVAPNELAMSKAKLSKAKAELSLASAHLQFTRITAPFSGFIDHLNLKLGSMVEEGDLITTLSDNSEMWVYFNVPEAAYLDYKANEATQNLSEVALLMANNKTFNQKGKVETIEADFNNETGNIAFRATFPNPDNLLRNGQTGNILMSVPMQAAVIVPQKATFEIMDKRYIYTIDKDKKVHLTPIVVSAELPNLFIVTGLNGHEKILLEGIRKVQDNDKITYKYEAPRSVLKTLELPSE